jgi:hypothetical protein
MIKTVKLKSGTPISLAAGPLAAGLLAAGPLAAGLLAAERLAAGALALTPGRAPADALNAVRMERRLLRVTT